MSTTFTFDTTVGSARRGGLPTRQLVAKMAELREFVTEAGGIDAIIEEHGGEGYWDATSLGDLTHAEDSRKVHGLAARIRSGSVAGVREAAGDEGYFDATGVNDGEEHGVYVPDYTSDEWKAFDGSGDEFVAEHGTDSDLVNALTGAYLKVRFIDNDSALFDQDAYDAFHANDDE